MRKPQPNSRNCFVCGVINPIGLKLRFYETAPGEVTADVQLPEKYQGYPGVVHGGIVAAMLDEAAGRAHMIGDPPRFLFTARMDVRYRKNVEIGKPIHLVGRAGRAKSRTATASASIYDSEGNVLADADVLLVNVPDTIVANMNLDELGWQVYPDEG